SQKCLKTAAGVPLKKSPCSFIIKARKGGIKNGASFSGQRPCSPVQVETVSATQYGQSCLCASISRASPSLELKTRSHSFSVSASGAVVQKSQTGASGAPRRKWRTAAPQRSGETPNTAEIFRPRFPKSARYPRT